MGEQLSQVLEPIAAWFRTLGVPEPIVHWGHPVMIRGVPAERLYKQKG